MVSGFLISPYDQERICSGLAIWILIWSKVIAWPVWPRIFISSFMRVIPSDQRVELVLVRPRQSQSQRKPSRHPRSREASVAGLARQ